MRALWTLVASAAAVALLPQPAGAQAERDGAGGLNGELNESVVMVPFEGSLFGTELEVTLFSPAGAGPFPLAVINHGKDPDDLKLRVNKPRYRYGVAARELVKRGYLVAVPMRRGFGRSGGSMMLASCNVAGYGRYNAEDIRAMIVALGRRPDVDASRVLVVGISAGGLASVALGRDAPAGVKGIVNVAGGLTLFGSAYSHCWETEMKSAFATYGADAGPPQLWLYSENDRLFRPALVAGAFEGFRKAGGRATLVMLPVFKEDGHRVFGDVDGLPVWLPHLLAFMRDVGLPTEPVIGSGFAATGDVEALPTGAACRQRYAEFLERPNPKAFAIGGTACGWWSRSEQAVARALDSCAKRTAEACRLYAYDDLVVWKR